MIANSWMDHLKNHGYRLTGARNAVVVTVADAEQALTPLEVFDLARRKYATLGLVTVYRTLEKLEELNLVQRVHHPAGCQAFIAASKGHQHLLLCQSCGQAIYIDGDDLEPLIDKLSRQTGFRIDEHWLQFFGLCMNCQ